MDVGGHGGYALAFMDNLRSRPAKRVQLSQGRVYGAVPENYHRR
jgi:hypothetical protein